jgi:hypothetical protein
MPAPTFEAGCRPFGGNFQIDPDGDHSPDAALTSGCNAYGSLAIKHSALTKQDREAAPGFEPG